MAMPVLPGMLGQGLRIRSARPSDNPFLQQLHRDCRGDLCWIEADRDVVQAVIQLQIHAQQTGYASRFPDALYFVIEKQRQPIGKLTLDFSDNEVHVVDWGFIPAARGLGYGATVLGGLQLAAARSGAPLGLMVLRHNEVARALYRKLGFQVRSATPVHEWMVWYPGGNDRQGFTG